MVGSHRALWSLHNFPLPNCSALPSVLPDGRPPPQSTVQLREGWWKRWPWRSQTDMRACVWRRPPWRRSLHRGSPQQRVWTGCAGCQLLAYWSRRSSESGACESGSLCPTTYPISRTAKVDDMYKAKRKNKCLNSDILHQFDHQKIHDKKIYCI